ncbi:MAG: peptidoglycan-binding protein [Patescibacteria group bacterium]
MKLDKKSHFFCTIIFVGVGILFPLSIVQASGSISIQSLTPGISLPVGTTLTLTANASGFTNPGFSVEDNFGGGSLSSANINSSGYLSWTPIANDIGTHSLTITAGDSSGGASVSQAITVTPPVMTLALPSPSATVNAGVTVTFSSTMAGFSNPTYSVSDSFGGTVSNANISPSGYFSWVPSTTDIGNHVVTVTAKDAFGHSTNASQSITVNAPPKIAITSFPSGTPFSPGEQVAFTVTTSGISSPTFSIYDSFVPSTIGNANLNTSGNFSWTPNADAVGRHPLFIVVTDGISGNSLSLTHVINVETVTVYIQDLAQNSVYTRNPIYFTVVAKGFSTTTYSLSDSLPGSTVSNKNISALGYFYWVPGVSDVGLHILNFTAKDPLGHTSSTTKEIIVRAPSLSIQSLNPELTKSSEVLLAVGVPLTFSLNVSGFTYPSYTLSDTFSGKTTATSSNISTSGYFSWTPLAQDIGTHTQKIFASDPLGHSANIVLTIIVNSTKSPISTKSNSASITQTKPNHIFTTYLAPGSTGAEVTALQNVLIKEGFFFGTQGDHYGPQTKAAVIKYQAKHGLEQAGVIGPKTRAALNKSLDTATMTASAVQASSTDTLSLQLQMLQTQLAALKQVQSDGTDNVYKFLISLSVGSSGTAVTELQKRLTKSGVYAGPINGKFGPQTKAAVIKYQAKHGLEQAGVIGPKTRAALNAE